MHLPLHPTPYTITFIKIAVSFTSLIPSLIPPTDDREKTERTPKEYLMTKKALFLRLSPKEVDSFPEKVDFIPKTACLQALLWQGFGIPSAKTNTEK